MSCIAPEVDRQNKLEVFLALKQGNSGLADLHKDLLLEEMEKLMLGPES